MDEKKIAVVARMKAKPGKEAEVKRELLPLIAATRAEEGCITYDLHQGLDDPSLFMFYENWRSREDLEKHLEKPHLKAWMEKGATLLEGPSDVTLWQITG